LNELALSDPGRPSQTSWARPALAAQSARHQQACQPLDGGRMMVAEETAAAAVVLVGHAKVERR